MTLNPLTEAEILARLETAAQLSFHEKPFPQFDGRPPRAASVLLPLTRVGADWHLLFTRRTDRVEHHKGQVSFPGGAADPGDTSPEDTALREADEEIGLRRADVRLLGRLGEMLTVTNFLITPIVGVFPWPYAFTVHTIEVERVFTLPLEWLSDRQNWQEFIRQETGRSVITYFPYDGELLWGATARMTVEFIRAMGLISNESEPKDLPRGH
jgi:8-oxo-dGTP pyrophosphatase MutT (NUDIX family)